MMKKFIINYNKRAGVPGIKVAAALRFPEKCSLPRFHNLSQFYPLFSFDLTPIGIC